MHRKSSQKHQQVMDSFYSPGIWHQCRTEDALKNAVRPECGQEERGSKGVGRTPRIPKGTLTWASQDESELECLSAGGPRLQQEAAKLERLLYARKMQCELETMPLCPLSALLLEEALLSCRKYKISTSGLTLLFFSCREVLVRCDVIKEIKLYTLEIRLCDQNTNDHN